MNHHDHVALLGGGLPDMSRAADAALTEQPVWADIGSGGGAFTLALAELLGDAATIHSVDRDRAALTEQERAFRARFPATLLRVHRADFTQTLNLSPSMASSWRTRCISCRTNCPSCGASGRSSGPVAA